MYRQVDLPDSVSRTVEVESTRFRLHLGDRVFPQTLIGRDFKSGKLVYANCWGHITWIGLNPLNHSLMVSISGSDELRWFCEPAKEEAAKGTRS